MTSPAPVEGPPTPAGVGVPTWAEDTVDELREHGFLVPDELRLSSLEAWRQLVDEWERTTSEVQRASQSWYRLGRRLAAERLDKGDFERHDSLEYPRPLPGQPDLRPWQLNRDKDWVTVRDRFDGNRNCETYDVVRIKPGDSLLLDRAVAEKQNALQVRRVEMERLLHP